MANLSAFDTHRFPTELVAVLAADAVLDAECVGQFLQACGLRGSRDRPIRLPSGVLLELAAVLRVLEWEQNGIRVHLDAGLPSADELVDDLLQRLKRAMSNSSTSPVGTLIYHVVKLSVERMSWHGRRELAAEVALDDADEDALLEALADFLWKNRPR